ncbi:hypothetical protein F4802DRAFT_69216 [Xylaria palmicola]|nr:hypothetical protein F4802DRAFT_69216 [Xylaria palmicola]
MKQLLYRYTTTPGLSSSLFTSPPYQQHISSPKFLILPRITRVGFLVQVMTIEGLVAKQEIRTSSSLESRTTSRQYTLTHEEILSPCDTHGWKWAAAYTSILSVCFLFALDNTIVATMQPSILESLGEVELPS